MESFSFIEMWGHMGLLAKGVVFVLALMSVYSLGVMGERLHTLIQERGRSVPFVRHLGERLRGRDLNGALELSRVEPRPPIARIVAAALHEYTEGIEAIRHMDPAAAQEFDLIEAVDRAIERVKAREVAQMRRGLGALATIASAAPFVGLFGTVVGIINAFRAMASSGQVGLASVSAGIAEALVTTALGLFVAIPAVMVYNHLTHRVDELVVDMNDVASEVVNFILKQGKSAPASSTRRQSA